MKCFKLLFILMMVFVCSSLQTEPIGSTTGLKIDSWGRLGYTEIRQYIFAPPGGTMLLCSLDR